MKTYNVFRFAKFAWLPVAFLCYGYVSSVTAPDGDKLTQKGDSSKIYILDTVKIKGYILDVRYRYGKKTGPEIRQKHNVRPDQRYGVMSYLILDTLYIQSIDRNDDLLDSTVTCVTDSCNKFKGYYYLDRYVFARVLRYHKNYARFVKQDKNYYDYQIYEDNSKEIIYVSRPVNRYQFKDYDMAIYKADTLFYQASIPVDFFKTCLPNFIIPDDLAERGSIKIITPY